MAAKRESTKTVFHLLPNAHLDPVWLWDWREGLNEAVTTTNCMLDLMDKRKDLTFIRGEACLYKHIEEFHPKLFKRLSKRIEEGRWDVVGGAWIQPDTNLPSTEVFNRHFSTAQNYFMDRFGLRVRSAWATDSFGHSAGLPEILESAGIENFAFTRPNNNILPIAKPAFWWRGQGGAKILAWRVPVGWYGMERSAVYETMGKYLTESEKWGFENVAVFYGLGDHGGGSTKRQLDDFAAWAKAHPEVEMVHSTLHGFFDALRAELEIKGDDFIPEHKGELNFTLRGCYSSAAKLKFKYRELENSLISGERVDSSISYLLNERPACLHEEWEAALFNSFHDILPGSSVERAYDEQLAQIGGALHGVAKARFAAMNELAKNIDTSVEIPKGDHPSGVPFLVFNPHPYEYAGPLELEASLDYRPIWEYRDKPGKLPWEVLGSDKRPLPYQDIHTEHNFIQEIAWRKRAVMNVKIPPLGWSTFELRWRKDAKNPASKTKPALAPAKGTLDNGLFKVVAKQGAKGVAIYKNGKKLFGGDGLSVATFEDPYGSWGDHYNEPEAQDINKLREVWRITDVKTLEKGPLRAALWIRFEGGKSWLEMTLSLGAEREAVDVSARMLLDERAARVKFLMPACDGKAEYQVPGGSIVRENVRGEVPGGRWVKVSAKEPYGFASDALYNFDARKGLFRATVARTSHYACDKAYGPNDVPELPSTDSGEYRFKFLIGPADASLERLSDELEIPPATLCVPPLKGGRLERSGSIMKIEGDAFKLLALKAAEDGQGLVVRVQETRGEGSPLKIVLLGETLKLGKVGANKIATFRIKRSKGGISVAEALSDESLI